MKTIKLNPSQIITLNDYPLYSNEVLEKYFSLCISKIKIPIIPLIKKETVKKSFTKKILNQFEKFEKDNSEAVYFMLDGSHRTTASTLAGIKIIATIYEKDADIIEANKLVSKGKILKNGTLKYTLKENCKILNKHFSEKPYFMTVKQKTEKMLKEKVLPKKIIDKIQLKF